MPISSKIIILLAVLATLLNSNSYAQSNPIDSLLSIIENSEDEKVKIDAINELSYNYHTRDINEMNKYALEALALSQKYEYKYGIGMAFYNLGIVADYNGNIAEAIQFDELCFQIGEEINNAELKSRATNDLGIIYSRNGDTKKAVQYHNESLKYALEINDHLAISYCYLNLGSINEELTDSLRPEEYYFKALEHAKLSKSYHTIARMNAFLGEHFMYNEDMEKAKVYIDVAHKIALKINDADILGNVFLVLSNIHMEKDEHDIAINFARQGLEVVKKVGNHDNILFQMENMIYLHGELEQYEKAIAIGNEALDFAVENKNPSSALYLYRKLSKLYAANNDHKTAFDYSSQYIQLRDSTFSEEKTIAAAELEEQYNTKRKDIENKTLKEKEKANAFTIESQKHINFALFTIALLFMLLGASLFYAYDINKRRSILLEETVKERTKELVSSNEQLIKSNEELQNFAYIASHDLKEPIVTMTAFSTLLNKEVSTLDNQQLKDVSGFIHSNANRLLNLVQDLLEFSNISNQDQMAQFVDLNATLKSVTNIIRGNSKKEFEIVCNQTLPHIKSYESKMFTLFLNLISNGLKYNHSSAPMVKIAYTIDDSYCTFSISDNGIGVAPEHFEKIFMMFKRLNNRSEFEGSGLGLASCKKIVELMQGIIWVDSENRNGTTFYFSIPIELVDKIPSKSAKRLSASII